MKRDGLVEWWDKNVSEERKRFLIWLQNGSEGNDRFYKECKKNMNKFLKEAKEKMRVKFGEDMERAGQQRNKVFWTKIENAEKKRLNAW